MGIIIVLIVVGIVIVLIAKKGESAGKAGAAKDPAVLRLKAEEARRGGNNAQAEHYYIEAANSGDVEAMYQLGLMYSFDSEFGKDEEKSFYWFNKAAEAGKLDAMYYAAAYFFDKKNDADEAFRRAQAGANRGSLRCKQYLADNFYGFVGSKYYNKQKSIALLEEAITSAKDRDMFGSLACSLAYKFGVCYAFDGIAPDEFSDRKKACYCYLLSYFADPDYDNRKEYAKKTGFWPTEAEWNQWVQDAKQMIYQPWKYLN